MAWRDRICGEDRLDPKSIELHELNWREHPDLQRQALRELLDDVGFVQRVIVNKRTGKLLDGHLRVQLARDRSEKTVPVLFVDLSEDEERRVLASFDPIGSLAQANADTAKQLFDSLLPSNGSALSDLLKRVAKSQKITLESTTADREHDVDQLPDFSIFSRGEIVDAAFERFRSRGFPYRQTQKFVAMQELNKLAALDRESMLSSTLGYAIADSYHPHRFSAHARGMKSPVESYDDDRSLRAALEMQLELSGSIPDAYFGRLTLVRGTQTCSNFRPAFACLLYRRFCSHGDTVLDTSTGYGGRLIGFVASCVGGTYVGIDPNTATHEANKRLAADLAHNCCVMLLNKPAEDVDETDVDDNSCDFAFTSPPYFCKEIYSDESTQSHVRYKTADDWRAGFLQPMLALTFRALKSGKTAIVNIEDVNIASKRVPLVQMTIDSARAVGFEHLTTETFELCHRFGANMNREQAFERVLVFSKK